MKTIFIATDFSNHSFNASDYGVKLASFLGVNIVLFYAYQIPVLLPGDALLIEPADMQKAAEERLLNEVKALRQSEQQSIEIIASEGDPSHAIISESKKYEDCLIVCGMKGSGNAIKHFFGSTTLSLIKSALRPVLVIPESVRFASISNIGLAYDGTFNIDSMGEKWLVHFGERFHAKLYIITVLKRMMNEVEELSYYSETINQHFKQLNPVYKFPRSSDIEKGIMQCITDYGIQLLVIVPHHHNLFQQLFIKSETQQQVFHTHIPLLVLPEKTNPA